MPRPQATQFASAVNFSESPIPLRLCDGCTPATFAGSRDKDRDNDHLAAAYAPKKVPRCCASCFPSCRETHPDKGISYTCMSCKAITRWRQYYIHQCPACRQACELPRMSRTCAQCRTQDSPDPPKLVSSGLSFTVSFPDGRTLASEPKPEPKPKAGVRSWLLGLIR